MAESCEEPKRTDKEFLCRLRDEDPEVISEIRDRYQGNLKAFAIRLRAEEDDLDDLLQETFMALLNPSRRIRSLRSFLFAVLRNKFWDDARMEFRETKTAANDLIKPQYHNGWTL